MMTSTFFPAAAPPLPPPPPLDDPLEARPATTPTTTASSAITATSDSENLTRLLVMTGPFLPDSTPRLPGKSLPGSSTGENVFSSVGHCRDWLSRCQGIRLLDVCGY